MRASHYFDYRIITSHIAVGLIGITFAQHCLFNKLYEFICFSYSPTMYLFCHLQQDTCIFKMIYWLCLFFVHINGLWYQPQSKGQSNLSKQLVHKFVDWKQESSIIIFMYFFVYIHLNFP